MDREERERVQHSRMIFNPHTYPHANICSQNLVMANYTDILIERKRDHFRQYGSDLNYTRKWYLNEEKLKVLCVRLHSTHERTVYGVMI